MSYFEMGNAVFRGQLNAANGSAAFKLTAGAINAVDTVNIKGGAVSYEVFSYSASVSAAAGSVLLSMALNFPEAATVELSGYSPKIRKLQLDGVDIAFPPTETNYWFQPLVTQSPQAKIPSLYPPTAFRASTGGSHTLRIISDASGTTNAWLLARYIRNTGA